MMYILLEMKTRALHRISALLLGAALAWTPFIAACSNQEILTVRGIVLEVQGASVVKTESLTIKTEDGRIVTFKVGPEVGPEWSPGHLRQHAIAGEPVTVRYQKTRDALLAIKITD